MLASRIGTFEGLRVADLFAGTGALGLEALSRGAAHCLFVETDPGAVASIKRNIDAFGAGQRAEVRSQSVEYASPPPAPCEQLGRASCRAHVCPLVSIPVGAVPLQQNNK